MNDYLYKYASPGVSTVYFNPATWNKFIEITAQEYREAVTRCSYLNTPGDYLHRHYSNLCRGLTDGYFKFLGPFGVINIRKRS